MKNMTYSTFIMTFLSVADDCDMVCNPPLHVQVLRSVLGLQNAPDSHWLLKKINGHHSALCFLLFHHHRSQTRCFSYYHYALHCWPPHECDMAYHTILNLNWNRSDPDLYPEMQWNFLATGLTPNCKSHGVSVLQFCISSTKTAQRHAIYSSLIQIRAYWSSTVLMLLWYWFSFENMPVTELFVNNFWLCTWQRGHRQSISIT